MALDPGLDPVFDAAGQQYNVDPVLLKAVALTESNGNPREFNPLSGAAGMMQFIPSTAREQGLKDPYDPRQAIPAAAKYLDLLLSDGERRRARGDPVEPVAYALNRYSGGARNYLAAIGRNYARAGGGVRSGGGAGAAPGPPAAVPPPPSGTAPGTASGTASGTAPGTAPDTAPLKYPAAEALPDAADEAKLPAPLPELPAAIEPPPAAPAGPKEGGATVPLLLPAVPDYGELAPPVDPAFPMGRALPPDLVRLALAGGPALAESLPLAKAGAGALPGGAPEGAAGGAAPDGALAPGGALDRAAAAVPPPALPPLPADLQGLGQLGRAPPAFAGAGLLPPVGEPAPPLPAPAGAGSPAFPMGTALPAAPEEGEPAPMMAVSDAGPAMTPAAPSIAETLLKGGMPAADVDRVMRALGEPALAKSLPLAKAGAPPMLAAGGALGRAAPAPALSADIQGLRQLSLTPAAAPPRAPGAAPQEGARGRASRQEGAPAPAPADPYAGLSLDELAQRLDDGRIPRPPPATPASRGAPAPTPAVPTGGTAATPEPAYPYAPPHVLGWLNKLHADAIDAANRASPGAAALGAAYDQIQKSGIILFPNKDGSVTPYTLPGGPLDTRVTTTRAAAEAHAKAQEERRTQAEQPQKGDQPIYYPPGSTGAQNIRNQYTDGQAPPNNVRLNPDGSVTVEPTNTATFGRNIAERSAEDFFTRRKVALDAVQTLESLAQARELINRGVITGTGATWKLAFDKALLAAGINYNSDPTANTEAYMVQRAQEVGRIIKQFGAGTGLSDADRVYANKMAAGDITLNEESIRRILDITDRAARNVIGEFNRDASKLDPNLAPFPLTVRLPEERPPPEGPPPGARKTNQTKYGKPVWELPDGRRWTP